ncbi:predicted protein [Nematostella vectensis]|uniref:Reverse transcriptase domain-containing protein n=1 Tax=Nematostella vectensis TaxID=45351 RepID=A7T959_NEMVE|nr:predicted protein [Nematostella vectensis]|eukprot:XP_001619572.1 hypothetical protein NEMVEDRAFT_v1g224056 [Nematostella vectensis]
MEGVTTLKDLLRRGDLLNKIDLNNACLTISNFETEPKVPALQVEKPTLAVSSPPPPLFGLASAPRVFTKILKPVVAHLRKRGIRLIIYLDDILIMSASKELALKSILCPTRELKFLGKVGNNVHVPPKGQDQRHKTGMPKYARKSKGVSSVFVTTSGKIVGIHSGSFPSPPALAVLAESETLSSKEKSGLRDHVDPRPCSSRGADLVEGHLSK